MYAQHRRDCLWKWEFLLASALYVRENLLRRRRLWFNPLSQTTRLLVCSRARRSYCSSCPSQKLSSRGIEIPSHRTQWTEEAWKKFTLSATVNFLMNLSERKWNLKFHSDARVESWLETNLGEMFFFVAENSICKDTKKKIIVFKRKKKFEMSCEISWLTGSFVALRARSAPMHAARDLIANKRAEK